MVGICLVCGAVLGGAVLVVLRVPVTVPLLPLVATAVLYIVSHAFRAIRLALLATPILGISGRSAGLLHFVTAPAALLLPLKLGEIVRFQQLHWLGRPGNWLLPIVVLILDRLMDAVLIVLLFLWLVLATDGNAVMTGAVGLSLGMLACAVVAFGMLPRSLTTLQRYILINHQSNVPRRALGLVDRLRAVVAVGAYQLRMTGALVLLVSSAIWVSELAAMYLLLAGIGATMSAPPVSVEAAVQLVLDRTASEWSVLMGLSDAPAVQLAATLGLATLVAVWPLALFFYLRRTLLEPMRLASRGPDEHRRVLHGL